MSRTHCWAVLAGALLAALLLVLAGPSPADAVGELRLSASAADPTGPLVAVAALIAWGLAGWLALTVVLTLLVRVPGQAGRAADALTRRLAPPALRRLVGTALGATMAAGTLLAAPATAGPVPAPAPVATVPAPAPGTVVFDLDWPEVAGSTDRPAGGGAPDAGAAAAPDDVVVRPGDTLWGLAERALVQQSAALAGAAAPAPVPPAAQVACAWPTWWSANRAVIGDDPDLLLPGTVLRIPPADDPPR